MVSALAGEVLLAGLDDWVPLAAVAGLARRESDGTDKGIREASLKAVRELLAVRRDW
jgi:hypothetical protein